MIEAAQINYFKKRDLYDLKFMEGSLLSLNNFLDELDGFNQKKLSADGMNDLMRSSTFDEENLGFTFDENTIEIEEIDLSKINKELESANTTLGNSDQGDKDILDAINQSEDDSDPSKDYQAILQTQRSSIESLYKQISNLESK